MLKRKKVTCLKLDGEGFAIVGDKLAVGVLEVEGLGAVLGDEDHIELAVLQHAIELAITLAKGNGTGSIVVGNVDSSILALLVVVVGAFVLVELERSVLACINVEVDEVGRFLVAILDFRTERNYRAFTDINGNTFVWCIDNQTMTTLNEFTRVQVVPTTLWQDRTSTDP